MSRARYTRLKSLPALALAYTFLAATVLYAVVPISWLLLLSVEPIEDYWAASRVLIPSQLTINNFVNLLFDSPFPRWLANTLIVGACSSILSVLFCTMAAYAFVFHDLKAKEILFSVALLPVIVPIHTLIVPLFLMFSSLNLVNTYPALILPLLINAFGLYFMRAYVGSGVHPELIDSARVDGASEFMIFFRIVLPIITPALLTLGILVFITAFNDFIWPLVAVSTDDMYTVNVGLTIWSKERWNIQRFLPLTVAGAILGMLPAIVIFVLAQKYYTGAATLVVKG